MRIRPSTGSSSCAFSRAKTTLTAALLCVGLWSAGNTLAAPTSTAPFAVTGVAWLDVDANGERNKPEPGVAGVLVSVLDCSGRFVAAVHTDENGAYRLGGLEDGCYRLRVAPPDGLRLATAIDSGTGLSPLLYLDADTPQARIDVGLSAPVSTELGDRAWQDLNADGAQDVGEPGLANVRVTLLDCAGARRNDDQGSTRETLTDDEGLFVFGRLEPDCYRLRFDAPDGFVFSAPDMSDDARDSDADPLDGITHATQVTRAEGRFDVDAGLFAFATVGDWVWLDGDGDGIQDLIEPGVTGVQVLLLDEFGAPLGRSATTDSFGYYEFSDVRPGNYRIQFVIPAGFHAGATRSGNDSELDSDANALGMTRAFSVTSGMQHYGVDMALLGGTPIGITLEKFTNGDDADEPLGPYVEVGGDVVWEYVVTNIGDADLFEIAVVDDQGVSVTCPSQFLASGTAFTCTASTDDAQAGQYVNLAEVCGNDQTDDPVTVCDSDASHYFGSAPAIAIEKLTNSSDSDTPPGQSLPAGDVVNWEYIVTNAGNVPLTGVDVTDDQGVNVTCPTDELDPGVSMTCTASGTAQAGQYANIGTATGTPPVGPVVQASDASHYFGADGRLILEKLTNGEDADMPPGPTIGVGEAVTWEYVVTNDGNVPLTNVTVTDDQGVNVVCPPLLELLPGASTTCTATGVATAGQYTNIGTACALINDEIPVCATDTSHYLGAPPGISIEKRTQNEDADTPPGPAIFVGSAVEWEYVVTNTGGTTLTDIVVTDDQGVAVACPATTLGAGESFTCLGDGVATAGQYMNVGEACAMANNEQFCATDQSHYNGIFFEIEIEKSTNGVDADAAPGPFIAIGEPVAWTYTVTNTGNIALNTVTVTDDQGVAISCPADSLAPGASFTCSGSGVASDGQYANVGTACGLFDEEQVCDDDTSHYFGAGAGLDIEKLTNGEDADVPPGPAIVEGEPVNWTYIVTNTGNITMTNIVVTDDQGVTVSCPADELAPSATFTCTGSGTAVEGQYANIGSVTGQGVDGDGNPVGGPSGDNDPSHYDGQPPATAILGDFVFSDDNRNGIQDPGEAGIPGVTVNLWIDTDGDGTPDQQVGTTTTDANGQYLFPDLDSRLTYIVQFIALPGQPFTAANQGGNDAADSDADPTTGITGPIDLAPGETNLTVDAGLITLTASLTIDKATNGADADVPPGPAIVEGDPVTWTYTVTNTGELTVDNITVSDDQGVTVSCPTDTLAPGATLTCTASGVATAGQYANIGTVTGQPTDGGTPVGPPVSGSDPSHYFGAGAGLDIEKLTNGEDADVPPGPAIVEGEPVNWTYIVTNTGNITMTNIVVTDDQGVTVSCPADELAPSATFTCTGSGTAVEGQYANIGSVTGQGVDGDGNPVGGPSGDNDPSHYDGQPPATAILGDFVFSDDNRNGIQDPGEAGIPGVTVNLWIDTDGDGTPDQQVGTTTTDANGQYLFPDLDSRLTYIVQFIALPGQPFTAANQGGNDAADSDADPTTGITGPIDLAPGETNLTVDAGLITLTASLTIDKATNGADADVPPGPAIVEGDPVTWTYTVTNTGELTVDNITVSDDQGVTVSCPTDTLAPGATLTCTASGVATAGQYANIGTVTGQPTDGGTPVGPPVSGSDPSHYFGAGAGLDIEKLTNGEDADVPPGPAIVEGEPVNWTYIVTNTGNITMTNIVVTDDQGVTVSCPADELAPSATFTCTGSGTAVEGQYANIGSVTGQGVDGDGNPVGGPSGDNDPSHYDGQPPATAILGDFVFSDDNRNGIQDPGEAGIPGVTVNLWIDTDGDGTPDQQVGTTTTDANGQYLFPDLDSRLTYIVQFIALPGQPFTAANQGGNDAADSDADPTTGITGPIDLAPGETNLTVDAGLITLTASLTIDKATNGADADVPPGPAIVEGDPVTWTYTVTNTGELTVDNITVSDDQGVTVSCPTDTLAPGATLTCTASGVATAGQYANIGTVTGQPTDGGTPVGPPVSGSDPSHYFGAGAGLDIEKLTNGEDADVPPGPAIVEGEPVNWTYIVTNTGNITMTNIVVTDDQGVTVSCPADELAPSATFTCTGSGTAVEGQYANIGSVTGQGVDGDGNPVGGPSGDNDPSHYIGEPTPIGAIGDRVFIDTNRNGIQDPGENGLSGITVNLWVDTDGDGTPDQQVGTTVSGPGGMYLFADLDTALTYIVQFVVPADLPITAPDQGGNDALDSDADPATGLTPPITLQPGETNTTIDVGVVKAFGGLTIEKSTNGVDADVAPGPAIAVGAPVTWTYTVTNSGDLTLIDVAVTDSQGVIVTCPANTIEPGQTLICTGSGVATVGQYMNTGSATAQPTFNGLPVGPPVSGSDPSHYFGAGAGLDIEKLTNGVDADTPPGVGLTAGEPVQWTYIVTNTGNVTVSGIVVSDNQGVAVNCPGDTLAPSASFTCTGSGVAQPGQYANIGSASGQGVDGDGNPVGDPVGDQDSSHYFGGQVPAASIGDFVFIDGDRDGVQDPGEQGLPGVTVNLWVDNDGDGTPDVIVATTVSDGNGAYSFTGLDPTLTYFVEFGTVPGFPFSPADQGGDDGLDSDPDQATGITGPITLSPGQVNNTIDAGYIRLKVSIDLQKLTNGEDADAPTGPSIPVGEPVVWSYIVTNLGEVALASISVTDSEGVVVTCPATALDPGSSLTCTGSGIATAGQYANTGIVTGQPVDIMLPVGDPISDSDMSHYFGAEVCTPGFVADFFNQVSYQNNDGDMDWSGGWKEFDPRGGGPSDGAVRIDDGRLKLNDYPDSGQVPSIQRPVDLSGYAAAVLSFDWATSSKVDKSDEITLFISADGGATFDVLDVFSNLKGSHGDTAVYNISAYISDRTVIRFAVTYQYGGRRENFMVDNLRIDKKCDGDPTDCAVTGAPDHALWLPNFNGDGETVRFDLDDGAVFERFADGTARLIGVARRQGASNEAFDVDIDFAGRTDVPPPGSPKNNYGADTSDWQYYPQWSGMLTGLMAYRDARIELTRAGPSFQIGTGANDQQGEQDIYGGSGWFGFTTLAQGDKCDEPGDRYCIVEQGKGDLNVRIDCAESTVGRLSSCTANPERVALRLPGLSGGGRHGYYFEPGATLTEGVDGVSRLSGTLARRGERNYAFDVNLVLGDGLKAANGNAQEYSEWGGTLVGARWNAGARVALVPHNGPLRIGVGAGQEHAEDGESFETGFDTFAVAARFAWTTLEQSQECGSYGDCMHNDGKGRLRVSLLCD